MKKKKILELIDSISKNDDKEKDESILKKIDSLVEQTNKAIKAKKDKKNKKVDKDENDNYIPKVEDDNNGNKATIKIDNEDNEKEIKRLQLEFEKLINDSKGKPITYGNSELDKVIIDRFGSSNKKLLEMVGN